MKLKKMIKGFTLIELMIVVAIIGVYRDWETDRKSVV